jgi:predicted nucleotidyltransferase
MATIQLPPDFKDFLKLLNEEQVEYLLVGGYAVGFHGYPRATKDMDIWVAISPENAERLVRVFCRFGFSPKTVSPTPFLNESKVIEIGIEPFRIDVIMSISGVQFAECYAKKIDFLYEGIKIKLISLEDLKTNKRATGRSRDLADVEDLP